MAGVLHHIGRAVFWRLTSYGLIIVFGAASVWASDTPERVTFTRDVAPILFENCVACHRPGEVAPMSLRTYAEARPWARAIKDQVVRREMPPWFADPAYGHWKNEATLTDREIKTIVRWVDQGAGRGDVKDMPALPEFPAGWQFGEPDFVVELPEVNIPARGPDYFPNLLFSADVPENEWVQAVEIRPSNREVAHHVVIFMDGFDGMSGNFDVLGVWSAGTAPNVYPKGMGRRIKPGQRFRTNMHYHPNGTHTTDRTRIGLHFGDGALRREITSTLTGSVMFKIPAGASNHEEVSSWYVVEDIKIVSVFPHMHLRGKDMRFTAVYPDGRERVLLSVPKYDFDWQLFYYPEEEISLPAGSRIDIEAHYDNSENNPNNPDPTRPAYFGTGTDDEMMFGLFEYYYDDGPERDTVGEKDRMAQVARSYQADNVYAVDFVLGGSSMPSVLYLPKEGDGSWIVSFRGTQLHLRVRDVVWDGGAYTFTLTLRFGRTGRDIEVAGRVDGSGAITGRLKSAEDSFMLMSDFEGRRVGM